MPGPGWRRGGCRGSAFQEQHSWCQNCGGHSVSSRRVPDPPSGHGGLGDASRTSLEFPLCGEETEAWERTPGRKPGRRVGSAPRGRLPEPTYLLLLSLGQEQALVALLLQGGHLLTQLFLLGPQPGQQLLPLPLQLTLQASPLCAQLLPRRLLRAGPRCA